MTPAPRETASPHPGEPCIPDSCEYGRITVLIRKEVS